MMMTGASRSPLLFHAWLRMVALLTLVGGVSPAGAQQGVLRRLFHHDVEIITVTDMTPEGRLIRQPTSAHPVYYEAVVIGYQDHGRSIAGMEPPPKKEMLRLILKILRDHGFHPANAQHEPEILLTISWGTLNNAPGKAILFMGGDKLDILWELEKLSFQNSARALTRYRQPPVADFVKQATNGPLYVISIEALDRATALEGKIKTLWHTKVSCPALGLGLAATLKEMIRQAGPYIGRETELPVHLVAPPPDGRVDVGELKVIEAIDPDTLPITDVDLGPEAVGPEAKQRREKARAR